MQKNAATVYFLPLRPESERFCERLVALTSPERAAPRLRADARKLSVYSEALLRLALSAELGISNREIRILKTELGQPYPADAPIYVSLSHTQTAVAAAVAPVPVGVDAEKIRPFDARVPARRFTDEEQSYLSGGGAERFFEIWTKKEARLKECGLGMRIPMSSFCVLNDARLRTFFRNGYAVSVSCSDSVPIYFTEISEGELERAKLVSL